MLKKIFHQPKKGGFRNQPIGFQIVTTRDSKSSLTPQIIFFSISQFSGKCCIQSHTFLLARHYLPTIPIQFYKDQYNKKKEDTEINQ